MLTEFERVTRAIQMRPALPPGGAQRLFNGFTEGWAQVVIEQFADTLVIYNHAQSGEGSAWLPDLSAHLLQLVPEARQVLVKHRHAQNNDLRKGELLAGSSLPDMIEENGVRYALNLRLNQDASFYLDTRSLRAWLKDHLKDRTLLNTFAYTGSLGVAALAGGARQVMQCDSKRAFLALSKRSAQINNLPPEANQMLTGDFFRVSADLRRQDARFDCVVLDPPFFAAGSGGRIDLQRNAATLINKVRPLINDGGWLAAINNALFLSGQDYMQVLTALAQDGYMRIETLLPVAPDCSGYPETITNPPPADPAPFNHSTKIAILRVRRK
ncbi:MAG: SAM-dependent methyltransferase [Anaerolineae bacterium]|nr:SAM-dependent methyltransferase [Anaerolineae bacterium]